jgi:hypothetical protein
LRNEPKPSPAVGAAQTRRFPIAPCRPITRIAPARPGILSRAANPCSDARHTSYRPPAPAAAAARCPSASRIAPVTPATLGKQSSQIHSFEHIALMDKCQYTEAYIPSRRRVPRR